jgi:uncharacterized OB-fold protein
MIPELVDGLVPPAYALPWWDALREHRLTVQHCVQCDHRQHHPRPLCVTCGGVELDFVPISPRGTVLTHTTIHRAPLPELRALAPYSVALVQLDHGIRMFGGLSTQHSATLRIGSVVETGFLDVTDDVTLLRFVAAHD